METITTNGVKISVEVAYQAQAKELADNEPRNIFAYRVTIQNLNSFDVQLLRRHWHITNGLGVHREVKGPGVIGEQPVMHPHGSHRYVSYCPLVTDIGKMYGTFLMKNLKDGSYFEVDIPKFLMLLPQKEN